ncbi:MAG: hypothetical protein WA071_19635 [Undibacterium umbellatum]|uniref:hypothetical protein n=1 Tax=Undibacterium umbellatum TaxID=2762300 RepID=UPI003BB649A1
MTIESTLILGEHLTKESFVEYLKKVGKIIGEPELAECRMIYNEESRARVDINLLTGDSCCFEQDELDEYEKLLGTAPLSFIELSFFSEVGSTDLGIQFTKALNSLIPVVLDTGFDKVFSPNEIPSLTAEQAY